MFKKLWESTREFVADVKVEVKKVSFPSRAETMGSTMVVIVFCVLMSLFLSVADSFLVWLISKVI
ncbi:MAG: preprotein translocase subunit SecE [Nitrospirae bacterium]|nr:MAG: preprotein translocase subunit SecE [Nitrospirota bacterium]